MSPERTKRFLKYKLSLMGGASTVERLADLRSLSVAQSERVSDISGALRRSVAASDGFSCGLADALEFELAISLALDQEISRIRLDVKEYWECIGEVRNCLVSVA